VRIAAALLQLTASTLLTLDLLDNVLDHEVLLLPRTFERFRN